VPGAVVFEEPATLQPSYLAPYCTARGGTRSSLFHPDRYSLWKVNAELDEGAELGWGSDHGDEAIFVIDGTLDIGGRRCGPDGAVICESGVPATLRALTNVRLVHFGPVEAAPPTGGFLGAPSDEGRGVHVVDADEAEAQRTGVLTFFSDGSCPTCRAALFTMDRRTEYEPRTYRSHKHSEDEIIHVLEGEIDVGPVHISAGMGVAVPGDRRYGFKSTGPLRFLNYRRDISTVVHGVGTEPELENRQRMRNMIARNDPLLEEQE
jgi:mannose-6-phosphate isomerase-like protein (cupin superfamily)